MAAMSAPFPIRVQVDASRALAVSECIVLLMRLVEAQGHAWTDEEQAKITAALEALELKNIALSVVREGAP